MRWQTTVLALALTLATIATGALWWGTSDEQTCEIGYLPVPRPAAAGTAPFRRPANSDLHLVDSKPEILGAAASSDAATIPLDLGAFRAIPGAGPDRQVTLRGELPAPIDARSLRLTLASVDVTSFEVITESTSSVPLDVQRRNRRTRVDVPAQLGTWEHATFRVELPYGTGFDLQPVLLRAVEVRIVGTSDPGALDAIVAEAPEAAWAGRTHGVSQVVRDHLAYPTLFVAAGVTLHFDLHALAPGPRFEVQLGRSGSATPSIHMDGRRVDTKLGTATDAWTEVTVDDLGRTSEVELACAGQGYCLFADPTFPSVDSEPDVPDVLVYLVDTLRADRIGAWGYPDAHTSTIDRLAGEGWQFGFAISPTTWTTPSIPTLMTGLYPSTHDVRLQGTQSLPEGVPVLAQAFRDAGWRTANVSASILGTHLRGLDRGFDIAWLPDRWAQELGPLQHPSAQQLHTALEDWVDRRPERPFFAYVHALEVHEYFRELFEQPGRERYDVAVSAMDGLLGELLARLAERRRRPLLVALVSDHGESFDHGYTGHGGDPYQSQIHVPVVLWASKGLSPFTTNEPVSLADVAPTLLELLDLPPLPETDGESLLPLLAGGQRGGVVASQVQQFYWLPTTEERTALLDGSQRKVVEWAEASRRLGFDLQTDPCERHPSDAPDAELSTRLDHFHADQRARAARFSERYGSTAGSVITVDEIEQLRALGYVEGGAP